VATSSTDVRADTPSGGRADATATEVSSTTSVSVVFDMARLSPASVPERATVVLDGVGPGRSESIIDLAVARKGLLAMLSIPQRLAAAVQHHEAGRWQQAEALYRDILHEAPRHPHALHLLGVAVHQAGRHREAIDLINQALAVHGPHPVFHSNLAAVYLAAGLLVEAEGHCREALRLNPNLPDACANLGIALRRKGQVAEAASAFREALRLKPNHADAARNLRELTAGPQMPPRLAEVYARLLEMVRLDPGNPRLQNDLGMVLLAAEQAGPAVQHLQEAVRLKPDYLEAYTNLGSARQALNQPDEAMQCYRAALRVNPAYTPARTLLGHGLQTQGRTDEALAEYRETLRVNPNDAQALYLLSELAAVGAYRFPDDEVRRVRELAARSDLPVDDLCRLNFAAAQILDKSGSYDEAFAHCRRANELRQEIDRRCGNVYDPTAQTKLVDRLIATCTPAWFERVRGFGSDSELPVFVVGIPRSGTTLAEQIIASHPRAHGAGELRDIGRMVGRLPQRLGGTDDYPECLNRLDAATARGLADEYLQRLRQLGGPAIRVVDKFPTNFLYLGLIAGLFPRARVVHCRRDPVDTCLSCYFQNFADPLPFTLDLGHLGHYYREYRRLMDHWSAVLPLLIFHLEYEGLTKDQEAVSRQLVQFCGLEWDDRCLRFHESRRPVQTASALQVRQPLYRTSVGRWNRYKSHLRTLLEALGNDSSAHHPSLRPEVVS
jgi:tetratricopeptide (TPR) repeat protein